MSRQTPFDELIVDELLREAGCGDEPGLKAALMDLRSLADGYPVVPSPELGALMLPGPASPEPACSKPVTSESEPVIPEPVNLDAVRRRKHRRAAVTVLVVAASMGAGTAAVAATDPGFRETAQHAITTVVEAVTHSHSGQPAPTRGAPGGSPGSSGSPARVPDLPVPAQDAPGRSGNTASGPAVAPPTHATKPSPAQQRGH